MELADLEYFTAMRKAHDEDEEFAERARTTW